MVLIERHLTTLALVIGLGPIVAIHLTYLVSAAEGYVPWCFPYIDSCTSISATGRHGTAWWLFKATMLPYAGLLILFWHAVARRLRSLGDASRAPGAIYIMGTIAGVFLIVYTVALGAAGELLQLQRRIGIILYFSMTAFCELLLTWRLGHVPIKDVARTFHLGACASFLTLGLVSVALDATMTDYDSIEDAFEWTLALIMHLYFLALAVTLHQTKKRAPKGS